MFHSKLILPFSQDIIYFLPDLNNFSIQENLHIQFIKEVKITKPVKKDINKTKVERVQLLRCKIQCSFLILA